VTHKHHRNAKLGVKGYRASEIEGSKPFGVASNTFSVALIGEPEERLEFGSWLQSHDFVVFYLYPLEQ